MSTLGIFIADGHQMFIDGLKVLINAQSDMKVVGEADDGRKAWRRIRDISPDVVILDVSIPVLNNINVITLIKRVCQDVKILSLTATENKVNLRQTLEAGANGYIHKKANFNELKSAIRLVATGGIYLSSGLAANEIFSGNKLRGRQNGNLSQREKEVLLLVAWGYGNKEIASDLNICVKTVESHKKHVLEKLDLNSRSDIVRYAFNKGWLQECPVNDSPA